MFFLVSDRPAEFAGRLGFGNRNHRIHIKVVFVNMFLWERLGSLEGQWSGGPQDRIPDPGRKQLKNKAS
jgi:hypothetical protein